jgi:hypothetical protein
LIGRAVAEAQLKICRRQAIVEGNSSCQSQPVSIQNPGRTFASIRPEETVCEV